MNVFVKEYKELYVILLIVNLIEFFFVIGD